MGLWGPVPAEPLPLHALGERLCRLPVCLLSSSREKPDDLQRRVGRNLRVRFAVGVRVSEVYESERVVDGSRAHVTGWAYQTLDGHFEQGEMHYQVWKWLDSGAVEFRLHAVSKAADTGPWLLRTGFRVLGRTNQLRFYRQICRRVRRLTEATLEARRVAEAA
jgi:hypothetical protein